jgi:ribosomal-protein-alanine N-acetyltransferase
VSEVTSRLPQPEDLSSISVLLAQTIGAQRPIADLEAELSMTDRYLRVVETNDGRLVGWLAARFVLDEVELFEIAVDPMVRRQGIGGALIGELVTESGQRGAVVIHLEVREGNAAARALYGAWGFSEAFVRKGYYVDGENAVIYRLNLSPSLGNPSVE